MRVTKRERHLLWIILEHDIHRYLISNSCQRLNGFEKAERLINISKIISDYLFFDVGNWKKIHNYLADDRLYEAIGFQLKTPLYEADYDKYAERFFNVIINNLPNMLLLEE